MALRYQEVKLEIKKLILSSKEGSRIPSRNFLSRKYQVARNTIDKAITELEQEGYLNSVKGSGTYVTGRFSRNINIGVILPSLMGDVYPQFISGIENYATANHINVVLLSSESIPEKQKRNIYQMIEMEADGCIIIPIINSEMSFETLDLLKKKKIPFVLCNRSIDGLNAPFVGTNNHYGAYMATKHLIEGGCRRLSYLSQRKYSTSISRYNGFKTALLDCQEEVEEGPVLLGNYEGDALKEKLQVIFSGEKIPDGVHCFDDMMATVLYSVLQEKRLVPGKDVKVVGYNDSSICNILPVPLSSVSSRSKEMGKEAIRMMMEALEGGVKEEAAKWIIPELKIRESSRTEKI